MQPKKKGTAGIQQPIPAELRRRLSECNAGARLKTVFAENRRHYKSLFPSIITGNVNSLPNKIDELSAMINQQIYRESSLFIFAETWLNHLVPDANVDLVGIIAVRADRYAKASEKAKVKDSCMSTSVNTTWFTYSHSIPPGPKETSDNPIS